MIHKVLLPLSARSLLSRSLAPSLSAIYYVVNKESLLIKIKRKAGILNENDTLSARLEISADMEMSLEEVEAVWLAPDFWLPVHLLEPIINKMPLLRWVYWQRTGTENMHTEMFKAKGIALSNSGTLASRSVAEMNLSCIMAQAKRLPDHFHLQRKRHWKTLFCDTIEKQTTGIIGTGNIARETAKLCRAVGMRVIAATRNPAKFHNNVHPFDHVYHLGHELEVLLHESDYVVIAIPLNDETRSLIGMVQFKAMRESAALLNPARHQIVDENALCTALSENLIAAAYLDVLFNRRLYPWDKIYRTKNLYITHYSSAHFRNKQEKALEIFLRGLEQEAKTGSFPCRVV